MTDIELRDGLLAFKAVLEGGRMRVPQSGPLKEGFLAIRKSPEGDVDLSSVNSIVRTTIAAFIAAESSTKPAT